MQIEVAEMQTSFGKINIVPFPVFLRLVPREELRVGSGYLFCKETPVDFSHPEDAVGFETRMFEPKDLSEMSLAQQLFRHADTKQAEHQTFETNVEDFCAAFFEVSGSLPTHLIELGNFTWAVTNPKDWVLGIVPGSNEADLVVLKPGLQIFRVPNQNVGDVRRYK